MTSTNEEGVSFKHLIFAVVTPTPIPLLWVLQAQFFSIPRSFLRCFVARSLWGMELACTMCFELSFSLLIERQSSCNFRQKKSFERPKQLDLSSQTKVQNVSAGRIRMCFPPIYDCTLLLEPTYPCPSTPQRSIDLSHQHIKKLLVGIARKPNIQDPLNMFIHQVRRL